MVRESVANPGSGQALTVVSWTTGANVTPTFVQESRRGVRFPVFFAD